MSNLIKAIFHKSGISKKNVIIIIAGVFATSFMITACYIYGVGSLNTVKMCSGVKISFFAGADINDIFAKAIYKGVRAAQADLGADVTIISSNWDSELMASQFKTVISKLPDAIAMMGHPGAVVLGPLIDEAERKGIIVTLQNVDLPLLREKYASNGLGYVGQSLYSSGTMVSNGLVRKYMPAPNSEAIVFGVDKINDPSRYERTQGIIDGLVKNKIIVHEILISSEVQKDPISLSAETMFKDAFAEFPNAKILVIDHGSLTALAGKHLESLGKKPGDYITVGFDLSPQTIGAIRAGYIGLVLDQQPYLQGYLPILQACMTKKYGFAGMYIDTGTGLIDESNVGLVADLVNKNIR